LVILSARTDAIIPGMPNRGRGGFSWWTLGLIFASACAPTATPPRSAQTYPPTFTYPSTIVSGDSNRTVDIGGIERSYVLHTPPGLFGRSAVPVVFVFHGFGMDGEVQRALSGFNTVADAGRFLAVYPNGSGPAQALSWNAGTCCGSAAAGNIDESAFVRGILADLEKIVPLDAHRIYAAGFSNGAFLAYRLACEMSGTFAAIAPIAGNVTRLPCEPADPVSVIHLHGLSDPSMPYEDADVGDAWTERWSVLGSIAFWAEFDGCSDPPRIEQTGIATHTAYSGCKDGTAVELYALRGIGHAWPPAEIFPATQTIWDFFAAHPKP
jgi:polyhydroxybutyrate depolymerase